MWVSVCVCFVCLDECRLFVSEWGGGKGCCCCCVVLYVLLSGLGRIGLWDRRTSATQTRSHKQQQQQHHARACSIACMCCVCVWMTRVALTPGVETEEGWLFRGGWRLLLLLLPMVLVVLRRWGGDVSVAYSLR